LLIEADEVVQAVEIGLAGFESDLFVEVYQSGA
jgi:hypothetical protein